MTEHAIELLVAWQRHVSADTALLDRLVARHRERHRRYHGVAHLVSVLRDALELAGDEHPDDTGAVIAAAFYHDAIYEPTAPANERASARLATRDLTALHWAGARVARVAAMIEATGTYLDDAAPDSLDVDTAVLLDADLAILAAEPAAYEQYVQAVRAEYRHLDDDEWRAGRTRVVQTLAGRAPLYRTGSAQRRWEHHARANLAAELATLTG